MIIILIEMQKMRRHDADNGQTWLSLPVVVRLSQRLCPRDAQDAS